MASDEIHLSRLRSQIRTGIRTKYLRLDLVLHLKDLGLEVR